METDKSENSSSERHGILRTPTLIVGAQRSGTTWLHRLLVANPRCGGGQESHFFVSFAQALRDFDRKLSFERPHGLGSYWTRDQLLNELRGLWDRLMLPVLDHAPSVDHLIEKTPDHALHLDVIREVLPNARIIHIVRDSRACAASLLAASRESWGQDWAPGHANDAAQSWLTFVQAAEEACEQIGPERFLRVHYEALSRNTNSTVAQILKFMGLSTDSETVDKMIHTYQEGRQVAPDQSGYPEFGELRGAVTKEPAGFTRSGQIDSWKTELTRREQSVIWKRTRDAMQRLGYDQNGFCQS